MRNSRYIIGTSDLRTLTGTDSEITARRMATMGFVVLDQMSKDGLADWVSPHPKLVYDLINPAEVRGVQ